MLQFLSEKAQFEGLLQKIVITFLKSETSVALQHFSSTQNKLSLLLKLSFLSAMSSQFLLFSEL